MPCSGRTLPTPHLGPPTAPVIQYQAVSLANVQPDVSDLPNRIASLFLHASSVESGSGLPWLSMAIPPKSWSWMLNWTPDDLLATVCSTLTASAVTSGPA